MALPWSCVVQGRHGPTPSVQRTWTPLLPIWGSCQESLTLEIHLIDSGIGKTDWSRIPSAVGRTKVMGTGLWKQKEEARTFVWREELESPVRVEAERALTSKGHMLFIILSRLDYTLKALWPLSQAPGSNYPGPHLPRRKNGIWLSQTDFTLTRLASSFSHELKGMQVVEGTMAVEIHPLGFHHCFMRYNSLKFDHQQLTPLHRLSW